MLSETREGRGPGDFRTAERQLSGDTRNTRKSAEKAHNEQKMLPPSESLHVIRVMMRLFQTGKTSISSVRAAAQLTNNQRVPWIKLEARDARTEGTTLQWQAVVTDKSTNATAQLYGSPTSTSASSDGGVCAGTPSSESRCQTFRSWMEVQQNAAWSSPAPRSSRLTQMDKRRMQCPLSTHFLSSCHERTLKNLDSRIWFCCTMTVTA